jgi:hypothetical protein
MLNTEQCVNAEVEKIKGSHFEQTHSILYPSVQYKCSFSLHLTLGSRSRSTEDSVVAHRANATQRVSS